MVHEVIGVFEYGIWGREVLDKVTDSVPDTDRDDPEHEKGNKEPIWACKLQSIRVGDKDAGTYESTQNDELWKYK